MFKIRGRRRTRNVKESENCRNRTNHISMAFENYGNTFACCMVIIVLWTKQSFQNTRKTSQQTFSVPYFAQTYLYSEPSVKSFNKQLCALLEVKYEWTHSQLCFVNTNEAILGMIGMYVTFSEQSSSGAHPQKGYIAFSTSQEQFQYRKNEWGLSYILVKLKPSLTYG